MTIEKKYIVALDQGTTSSRAVILDHDSNIVAVYQREFQQIYPKPGWVEHDPMDIWASQSSTLVEVLAHADIRSDEIAAIGITPTSVKPPLSGTKRPASRSTTLSSGRIRAPLTTVQN